jgi:hypothetical protein
MPEHAEATSEREKGITFVLLMGVSAAVFSLDVLTVSLLPKVGAGADV